MTTVPTADPLAASGLNALVGTWEGDGAGDYPTIEPFRYREVVTFDTTSRHPDAPPRGFLRYVQHTTNPSTGAPMHAEQGYVRPGGDGRVEVLVVQPTGLAEVHTGTFDGHVLDVAGADVVATPTAKPVRAVRRRLVVEGDRLVADLWMSYAHVDDGHHLHAELRRTG